MVKIMDIEDVCCLLFVYQYFLSQYLHTYVYLTPWDGKHKRWGKLKCPIIYWESQNSLGWKAYLSQDQDAQSPVQPDFGHFQGWGIYNLPVQPVIMSHHLIIKKCLPSIQYKPTLFQFKTITPFPVAAGLGKMSISVFLIKPLSILKFHMLWAVQVEEIQMACTGNVLVNGGNFFTRELGII